MEAEAQRDKELAQLCRKMRVLLGRIEEVLDAPHDADTATRVAGRLGLERLTEADAARACEESERSLVEVCCSYFTLATAKAFLSTPVTPAHLAAHLPGRNPAMYMDFFQNALEEDYLRLNPWNIGDLLFRMALVRLRRTNGQPSQRVKYRMVDLLYPRDAEALYRGLEDAQPEEAQSQRRQTDYEDETRRKFWCVALEPADVARCFERMIADHAAAKGRMPIRREKYLRQCNVLARSMWSIKLSAPDRCRTCYRVYKERFTRFLLDERLEARYAVALLMNLQRCGIRLRSIASRARDQRRRLDELVKVAQRAKAKSPEERQ